jgi:hypothetical protein
MGAHPTGDACDFGKNNNPDLYAADIDKVKGCFNKCKFSWGYKSGVNFHFQMSPGGGGKKGFEIW